MKTMIRVRVAHIACFAILCICSIAYSATETRTAKAAGSDAYTRQEFITLYEDGVLKTSDTALTIKVDEDDAGLLVKGTIDDIENERFTLSKKLDLGDEKAGRLIVNAQSARRMPAAMNIWIDDLETPVSVKMVKQKKDGDLSQSKYYCADVSTLLLTGEHEISFGIKYDKEYTDKEREQKTEVLLRSIFFSANSLPVVDFDIDESEGTIAEMNSDQSHQTECYGSMTVQVPDGYKSEYSDETYETKTYELDYIRGRGNSTWGPDKRPYKLKLEKKQDFFGMGANKHWVLLANYYDYTMLRNKYTYWLGDQMKMEFTPQSVFVDVVMNGEYLGSYYLCEQVRVGKSRVDIDDLEDTPDATDEAVISGGYLLSLGWSSDGVQDFNTDKGNSFCIERPEFDKERNDAQYNYIKDYVNKTEEAIYGVDFKDSDGHSYSEYLDVDSAIDFYIAQEFSLNGDGYGGGSNYLYKKRDGKLYWGPLWDFDFVAWGATEFYENNTTGFIHNTSIWMDRLLQDPNFVKRLKERWSEWKKVIKDSVSDGGQIDKYSSMQYQSQKTNYQLAATLYTDEGGEYGFYRGESGDSDIQITYDSEVERLKTWINERLEWFDADIDDIVPVIYSATLKDGDDIYAYVDTDRDGYISVYEIPVPKKSGYHFIGWYEKNPDGSWGEEFYGRELTEDIILYARWAKGDPASVVTGLAFPQDEFYIHCYNYSESDEMDDLRYKLPLTIMPFDVDRSEVSWKSDSAAIDVNDNGEVFVLNEGAEGIVTASVGDIKAECVIKGVSWYTDPAGMRVPADEVISVTEGAYAKIYYDPLSDEPYLYSYTDDLTFKSVDESIATVDDNGFVHAISPGSTVVVVLRGDVRQIDVITVKVTKKPLVKGDTFTYGKLKYKVTKTGKNAALMCTGTTDKNISSISIPATLKYTGVTYTVTSIGASAFSGMSGLKKVTFGKNISTIGKKAFIKCKKLSKLIFKGTALKKVGKNAFKNTEKTLKITAPKSKKKKIKKLVSGGR